MKLVDLIKIINGTVCNEGSVDADCEIKGGCGADLMSDVCNPQVVRTAIMADVRAIVFVRGKQPPCETIDLAMQENIPIISSPYGMFELCGRLYQAGLPSLERDLHQTIND